MAFLDSLKQSLFYGYGYNRNKPGYYDGPHTYHNVKGNRLTFYHVPSGKQVWFPAFITQFTETFKSNWNSEPVMGRPDHIKTFTGTARTVQLSWELPAADPEEAIGNLKACGRLSQFLYGAYQDSGNALSMTEAPVVKVRFANLLQDCSAMGSKDEAGVEAIIKSFSFEPVPDAGFYDSGGEFRQPGEMVAPKLMTCIISMDIIHMHDVSWRTNSNDDKSGWNFATSEGLAETFPHLPQHIPQMDAAKNKQQTAEARAQKWTESVNDTVNAYMNMRGKGGKLTRAGKRTIRNNIQSWPYTERDKFIFDVDSSYKAWAGIDNPEGAAREAERMAAEYANKAAAMDDAVGDRMGPGSKMHFHNNFAEEQALGRAMAESDIFKPETTNPFSPPVSPAAADFDWTSNRSYGMEVAEDWTPGGGPGGNSAYATGEWEELVNEYNRTSERGTHTGDRRDQWRGQNPPDWYANGGEPPAGFFEPEGE